MACRAADGEMSSSCVLNRFFCSIDSSLTRVVAVAAVYRPLHVLIFFNKRAWALSLSPHHFVYFFGVHSHSQDAGQVIDNQKSGHVILWVNLGQIPMCCDAAELRLAALTKLLAPV